jgi:hypothetical protein
MIMPSDREYNHLCGSSSRPSHLPARPLGFAAAWRPGMVLHMVGGRHKGGRQLPFVPGLG